MPRLTATRDAIAAPRRLAAARPAARVKSKKAPTPQDRLKSRTLFFRRVKRSIKPGLWVLGACVILTLTVKTVRAISSSAPVAASAGAAHGVAGLAAAAGFRVQNIKIIGADTASPEAIEAALGVHIGDPILGVPLGAAAARIAALGPVQTAEVERALPGTLIISITERAPYAIWQNPVPSGPKFVLIDKAGNVIADQNAAAAKRRDPNLILLVGDDAPQNAASLMTILAANKTVMSHVVAAERVDGLRWNLILKDHAVVKLPAAGEQETLAQLAGLQTSMALLDRPVEVIDLRLPGRLVIHPYPADTASTPANDHT
jgi:cell division protein FtsQ